MNRTPWCCLWMNRTPSFIPEDKLSRRAFALVVMVDVVLGRRMCYDVEFS